MKVSYLMYILTPLYLAHRRDLEMLERQLLQLLRGVGQLGCMSARVTAQSQFWFFLKRLLRPCWQEQRKRLTWKCFKELQRFQLYSQTKGQHN